MGAAHGGGGCVCRGLPGSGSACGDSGCVMQQLRKQVAGHCLDTGRQGKAHPAALQAQVAELQPAIVPQLALEGVQSVKSGRLATASCQRRVAEAAQLPAWSTGSQRHGPPLCQSTTGWNRLSRQQ